MTDSPNTIACLLKHRPRRSWQHALVGTALVVTILFTGCTTLYSPTRLHALTWPERQAQLTQLLSWRAKGALTAFDGNQAMTGYFSWRQSTSNYQLNVSGPMGIGGFVIIGSPNQVSLRQETSQTVSAKTPELLMRSQLGWSLPVSSLIYWIRGLPDPHYLAQVTLDHLNHLSTLRQEGWQIQLYGFTSINGIDLPTHIILRYAHTSLPTQIIRLRITHWSA